MRKIRELLRLKFEQRLSDRKIAVALSMSRSAVGECLHRATTAQIVWPLPEGLDDAELERRLYPVKPKVIEIPWPDFAHVHRELSRPGVTRQLVWEEYKAQYAEGLQYSAFCDRYREWLQTTAEPVLRLEHRAGEKCFVDYAGHTVGVIDRHTGEIREAQIFVAVLGCSNYTFAEASWTQALPDWLGSHVRALEFFGGTPSAFVPDNLKSGVDRAHRYDPDLNRAYAEFAEHYGVAILPARVRKPRDKAKVETGVQIVERWILARLRDRQFFSLAELNRAIGELLTRLNERAFQKLDGSRRSRFIELDQPALKALPPRAYEYAQWKLAKVHPDYHIEVEHAYYSVPYRHIGERVEVRMSARMIEVFAQRQLIASHVRLFQRGARATLDAHRPANHRAIIDTTIERLMQRAEAIAPSVSQVLREQFNRKRHPEEALRVAQGILRRADYSVRSFRLPRLIEELTRHRAQASASAFLKQLAKVDLLYIDDFGLSPLADQSKRDLLEILEDRYDKKSTLITSQLPLDQWHAYIDEPTLADAILDRLVHNSHRVNLKGGSMRKHKRATTLDA